ncbi:MAG: GNAT family N-acetyltransferase [Sneathiella sp.]|nr:GNAT family N-acetyltransferase [Sneathiella sp.]
MTAFLRNYRPTDYQCLKDIRSDYDLQQSLMGSPEQPPQVDVDAWLKRRHSSGAFCVVDDGNGNAVGFVQIHQIHQKSKYGWLGIALHPTAQGKGIGRTAMQALHKFAKSEFNLRKLLLEVRADNSAAIKLYEALGYRTIGNLVEHYFDGIQYRDVILMERMLATS